MTETARILIVDDTVINLQILGKILADSGYHVTAAKSAREALDFLQKKVPDMILLDVMMPVMDGFELCRTIKANPETEPIPVIFITALTETKDKVRGFKTGAVDYITKPLQPEEVLARVGTHLELQRQRRELKNLLATKDVFFSIISHDLRSPLSGLKSMCDLFTRRMDTFDDTMKRVVGEGNKLINLLLDLTENLLLWAMSQRGEIELKPERIDLAELAGRIIPLYHAAAGQKRIAISSSVPEGSAVIADGNMLQTILRNLISNAIKFTAEGGHVSISAMPLGRDIEIAVRDTGVGIKPENMGKLFSPGGGMKHAGTAGEKGSGLGLILCKDFVEKNGGTIRAESTPGRGSSFIFTLPSP